MNQEDHNKTEKNLITLLNWYRLKRVYKRMQESIF